MFGKAVATYLPDRRHGSIEQRWMTIDNTRGPVGATAADLTNAKRNDVVKYNGEFWRVAGSFGKYYGRWALVDGPVPLADTHRLMLQSLHVDKVHKPHVALNTSWKPWVAVVSDDTCVASDYSLFLEDDGMHKTKKMKKSEADLWD